MRNITLLLLTLTTIGGYRCVHGWDIGPVRVSKPDIDVSGAVHAASAAAIDAAKTAEKKTIFQSLRPLAAGAVTEITDNFFITACNQIKNVITDLHDDRKANFDMFGNITDDYINLVLNLNYHTRQKSNEMKNAFKSLLAFAEHNVRSGQAAPSRWMGVALLWSLERAKPMWVRGRVVPTKKRGSKGQIQYRTELYVNVNRSIDKFRAVNNRNLEYARLLSGLGIQAAKKYDKKTGGVKIKEKSDTWRNMTK